MCPHIDRHRETVQQALLALDAANRFVEIVFEYIWCRVRDIISLIAEHKQTIISSQDGGKRILYSSDKPLHHLNALTAASPYTYPDHVIH